MELCLGKISVTPHKISAEIEDQVLDFETKDRIVVSSVKRAEAEKAFAHSAVYYSRPWPSIGVNQSFSLSIFRTQKLCLLDVVVMKMHKHQIQSEALKQNDALGTMPFQGGWKINFWATRLPPAAAWNTVTWLNGLTNFARRLRLRTWRRGPLQHSGSIELSPPKS